MHDPSSTLDCKQGFVIKSTAEYLVGKGYHINNISNISNIISYSCYHIKNMKFISSFK